MKLPQAFIEKMKQQLGDELPAFLQSYTERRTAGLRANTLKITPSELKTLMPSLGEAIPWSSDGFYYDEGQVRPGKHPYYFAGLYYIQEPSAMLPAAMLAARPGERVLDLCAAPGGKSVQLAAQLARSGLLVVNDLQPQRAKALLKNIERYGVVNAIVLNERPERIAAVFGRFFDKVLVDAPCSGEGMFHKEPKMANEWSKEEVAKYAGWQADILAAVPRLLKAGGELVYSTCTFSREENEDQIERFVSEHPAFTVECIERLWPHKVRGEGHFAAKLRLSHGETEAASSPAAATEIKLAKATCKEMAEFSRQVWGHEDKWHKWLPPAGIVVERAGHILWEAGALPLLKGLKVLRSGWLLGTMEKGRFRPSQALAMGLPPEAIAAAVQCCHVSAQTEAEKYAAIRYLRGETIQRDTDWPKGWHLVCLDGYALGWAKSAGGWLKNEYPPGWRWEVSD